MRRGGICAALLLIATSPWQRAFATTALDPFTIDRTGAETRAAVASLPVTFRIEPPAVGVACPRWRVMTLVRASPDPTWRLVRSIETEGDREVILYGTPGRTTLVVVECPGRPGYSLHGPRVWGRRGAVETIHFRRRRTVRAAFGTPSAQTVRMVLPQQYDGDQWPECDLHPRGPVECIGVPYEATGVAVSEGRSGLSWAGAVPRAATVQTVSSVAAHWGLPDLLHRRRWRNGSRPPRHGVAAQPTSAWCFAAPPSGRT